MSTGILGRGYNPMTADEPDDSAGLREDEIELQANCLMDDEQWIACQFEDGRIGTDALIHAIATAWTPRESHLRIGGLILDELWVLAKVDATSSVDRGF
jgi:hypothetical protein